ncbi:MAG: hypothetical protein WBE91_14790 [Steroidobacteraceae bacterium]
MGPLRGEDLVPRMGGDEFIVVLKDVLDAREVHEGRAPSAQGWRKSEGVPVTGRSLPVGICFSSVGRKKSEAIVTI